MRLFLDECVPEPIFGLLQHLLKPDHEVASTATAHWGGKKDILLIQDVARNGYDAFLTADQQQMNRPSEVEAIKKSGMHHIRYKTIDGLDGLGQMTGAIAAMIRPILRDLEESTGQRLVMLTPHFGGTSWYTVVDPNRSQDKSLRYWPR